jgi:hypothetical protein
MIWKMKVDAPRCTTIRSLKFSRPTMLSQKNWNSGTNPVFLNVIKHLRVPAFFSNWNKTGTRPFFWNKPAQKDD